MQDNATEYYETVECSPAAGRRSRRYLLQCSTIMYKLRVQTVQCSSTVQRAIDQH